MMQQAINYLLNNKGINIAFIIELHNQINSTFHNEVLCKTLYNVEIFLLPDIIVTLHNIRSM